jgi:FkbM family methyltransferase
MKNYILKTVNLKGINLQFYDFCKSSTCEIMANEINNDSYDIAIDNKVNFKNDDVVIDIGGNIGTVSILLAKKYPFIKIYAFEPVYENWKNFKRNIKINNINNIKLFNLAVAGNNCFAKIEYDYHINGCSSLIKDFFHQFQSKEIYIKRNTVKTITLDDILLKFKIDKCKLLKIDCEGSEFEIFYNSKLLNKIEYVTGETHSYDNKRNNRESLLKYLEKYFPNNKIQMVGY